MYNNAVINSFEYLPNVVYHTDDSPLGKGATSYIKSGVFIEYISASYDIDIGYNIVALRIEDHSFLQNMEITDLFFQYSQEADLVLMASPIVYSRIGTVDFTFPFGIVPMSILIPR